MTGLSSDGEPFPGLASWKSIKIVRAGEITEIVSAGCYVRTGDDGAVLMLYSDEKMTARYQPQIGDFWIIYPDGYQAISPHEAFVTGYIKEA
jgi:hypothetical protein